MRELDKKIEETANKLGIPIEVIREPKGHRFAFYYIPSHTPRRPRRFTGTLDESEFIFDEGKEGLIWLNFTFHVDDPRDSLHVGNNFHYCNQSGKLYLGVTSDSGKEGRMVILS